MKRRSFIKFIASAVIAKSLLDNAIVRGVERSISTIKETALTIASTNAFNVGDIFTIEGHLGLDGKNKKFVIKTIVDGARMIIHPW